MASKAKRMWPQFRKNEREKEGKGCIHGADGELSQCFSSTIFGFLVFLIYSAFPPTIDRHRTAEYNLHFDRRRCKLAAASNGIMADRIKARTTTMTALPTLCWTSCSMGHACFWFCHGKLAVEAGLVEGLDAQLQMEILGSNTATQLSFFSVFLKRKIMEVRIVLEPLRTTSF